MAINTVTIHFVHLDNRPSDKVIDVLGNLLTEISWGDNKETFTFEFIDMRGKLYNTTLTPQNPMCALIDMGNREFAMTREPEDVQNLKDYIRGIKGV